MKSLRYLALAIVGILCSCGPNATVGNGPDPLKPAARHYAQTPIQHIVIIVQENRSVDDLFQFLPGANTQSYGPSSHGGHTIPLQPESLAAHYTLGHAHTNWLTEYNNGRMNGFDREICKGRCPTNAAFAYVPQSEVQPYYTLAESYAFADNFFESNQGPSFPAHQYLVSGTSTLSDGSSNKASGNPVSPIGKHEGGCDAPLGSLGAVINPKGEQPPSLRTFPCFARQSIMNEMDAAGVTWKYYQAKEGSGLWNAVDAIQSIWSNKAEMKANVIVPPSQVLTDISGGQLADVVWVTPTKAASDHPRGNDGSGPSWVASVVDAVGSSQYWNNTAIFILWDDWGGFYDHVTPKIYNSFELGFRVPLIVVSPYAKTGYVSHKQHEFGSILKFVEETFGLPSLGTTDVRSDDLTDCFNFSQRPVKLKQIHAKYSARYFFRQPSSVPDD